MNLNRKRVLGAAVISALVVVAVVGIRRVGGGDGGALALADATHGTPAAQGFAGSATCQNCHSDQYEAWRSSTHGTAGGPAGPETVIAPFDGTPIEFVDGRVTPTVESSGTYVFLVDRPGRPQLRMAVDGVVGRGHMLGGGTQGFLSAFPDGTTRFLPFDYSAENGEWFCNTAAVAGWWISGGDLASLRPDVGWVPISESMKLTDCGDWPPIRILGTDNRYANCQGCHGSQIGVSYDSEADAYRTTYTGLDINCESCHGPASEHATLAELGFPQDDVPSSPYSSSRVRFRTTTYRGIGRGSSRRSGCTSSRASRCSC